MKSKKRHQDSSDEGSLDLSGKSSTSSDSESEASSESDHRHKKRRKRDESCGTESDGDRRSKKRKNKKKKKKHGKKKRRSESLESVSDDENSSISEGEISPKKKRKHKHKHSKRSRKDSVFEDEHEERRLQSVVKERRGFSEEVEEPTHTYYQKEYRRPITDDYERESEVQRFYRGSSKEHRRYAEAIHYEKHERYADKYERPREKRDPRGHYPPAEYDRERSQREYEEYKRHQRYEEHRSPDVEVYRKPREGIHIHEHERGYGRPDRLEDRRRRDVEDERDYRERRHPPEPERYREREYPDRRDKYVEERDRYPEDRGRDRRERPGPHRVESSAPPRRREVSRSRSPEDRYREKRRPEREDRYREVREERRERGLSRPIKVERDRDPKDDPRARERKSRFADAEDKKEYNWGKADAKTEGKPQADKEKPNFGLSGKLTADANTVNGVVIKYTEPDDAKQPKRRWRFYPFKGDKALPILYIHRQSAFLIGRDKKVVDIALEHPSISKQHAALQYRATPFTRPDGSQGRRVRPYVIDLESANGTFVNNKKIEPRRYVELLERDVVKFGFSQREYVLLHENSKDDAQDDDHHDSNDLGAAVTTTDQIKHEKRVKEEIKEDGD